MGRPSSTSSPDAFVAVRIRSLPNGFRDLMSPGALGNARGKAHGTRSANPRSTAARRTAMGRSPHMSRQAPSPSVPDLARLARAPSQIRSRRRIGVGPRAQVVRNERARPRCEVRRRGSPGPCSARGSMKWSVLKSLTKAHTEGSTRFENCKITSLYMPVPIDFWRCSPCRSFAPVR